MSRFLLNNLTEVPPGRYRYFQADTRASFGPYSNFRQLVDAVRVHRKSNRLEAGDDLEAELQDWLCRNIRSSASYCHEEGESALARLSGNPESATGWDGSHKWAELHRFALAQNTPLERLVFLESFTRSVPCGTCRKHWRQQLKEHPISKDFTQEEFFEWTVERHSQTSRDIGKVEISVDEARKIWER